MVEQKRDLMPVVAVGLGVAAMGAGVYFFMKKPEGADPGDTIVACFNFTYTGEGGIYVIQVSLGNILLAGAFDHVEGLTWSREVTLTEPGPYCEEIECPLPEAATPQTYDAEALIRTPEMGWLNYLIKAVTKGAVKVRKA